MNVSIWIEIFYYHSSRPTVLFTRRWWWWCPCFPNHAFMSIRPRWTQRSLGEGSRFLQRAWFLCRRERERSKVFSFSLPEEIKWKPNGLKADDFFTLCKFLLAHLLRSFWLSPLANQTKFMLNCFYIEWILNSALKCHFVWQSAFSSQSILRGFWEILKVAWDQ